MIPTTSPTGEKVTGIGNYAFFVCRNLTSIIIPDSVTSIGRGVFGFCRRLTSINFNGTMARWNEISKGEYRNSYTDAYTIYCTDGTISKY